ncbi:MAG: endonuclease MutS2 [Armatimonadota bacterium]|nr:endonuclease MutS2 [Armatimonadota bacterium]
MSTPADARTLRVLEFPWVQETLAGLTVTSMGRERALALAPVDDLEEVRALLAQTAEAVALATEAEIPVRGARDVRAAAQRAAVGAVLEPEELLDVAQTLEVTRAVHQFLQRHHARAPRLAAEGARLQLLSDLVAELRRALDERGQVRDEASPQLQRVRAEQREVERRLRTTLDALVRDPAVSRLLQEPLITTRGDRFVVPVKAEHRQQFPGLVHDVSSSGATVFMEPLAVVPLGNRRRELAAAAAAEVARILARLSAQVGAHARALAVNVEVLAAFDVLNAKAALAARLRAVLPAVADDGVVQLRAARHPILAWTRGEAGVVPVDVELGARFRTLVITGPNTGGKTVTLKTIGLLVLMAQAGLAIPAAEGSRVAVFRQVHADIGDEQSIAQNLSTFSAHMGAIVEILRRVAPPALVLLDEVGAGTDPTEGVALARAIIETLHRRGVCTVVTTHYNELKMLASLHEGIENASVEFDVETLQPTFRLRLGLPGRSNALIVAQRLGLDPDVVAQARAYLAPEQVAIERVLEDLTRDRAAAERDRAAAAEARRRAEEAAARVQEEADRLQAARRQRLAEARQAVEALVAAARREVEDILAQARAARTEAAARAARDRLRAVLAALPVDAAAAGSGTPPEALEVGQPVLVTPLGAVGIVRAGPDAHDEVEVEVGALRTRVPRAVLRRPQEPAADLRPAAQVIAPPPPAVPLSLDVRGLVVDDALAQVDRYLDEAVRANLPAVTIVHGKGTGRLRAALHQFLRGHPHVRRFRLGGRGEGDEGATVVTLVSATTPE